MAGATWSPLLCFHLCFPFVLLCFSAFRSCPLSAQFRFATIGLGFLPHGHWPSHDQALGCDRSRQGYPSNWAAGATSDTAVLPSVFAGPFLLSSLCSGPRAHHFFLAFRWRASRDASLATACHSQSIKSINHSILSPYRPIGRQPASAYTSDGSRLLASYRGFPECAFNRSTARPSSSSSSFRKDLAFDVTDKGETREENNRVPRMSRERKGHATVKH